MQAETPRIQLSLASAVSALSGQDHRDHHLNPRARCSPGIREKYPTADDHGKIPRRGVATRLVSALLKPCHEVSKAWPSRTTAARSLVGPMGGLRALCRADWSHVVGGVALDLAANRALRRVETSWFFEEARRRSRLRAVPSTPGRYAPPSSQYVFTRGWVNFGLLCIIIPRRAHAGANGVSVRLALAAPSLPPINWMHLRLLPSPRPRTRPSSVSGKIHRIHGQQNTTTEQHAREARRELDERRRGVFRGTNRAWLHVKESIDLSKRLGSHGLTKMQWRQVRVLKVFGVFDSNFFFYGDKIIVGV